MNLNIFNNLLESILAVDSEFNITYANEAFSILVNIPLKRILKNKKISDIIDTEDAAFKDPSVLKNITESTPYREITFFSSSGQNGTVQYSLQKINLDSRSSWIYFFRDVTLEQQLQKKYKKELSEKEVLIDKLRNSLLETEFRYKINEITNSCFNVNEVINSLTFLFKDLFICENSASIILDQNAATLYLASGAKEFYRPFDSKFIENETFENFKASESFLGRMNGFLRWNDLDKHGYCVPLRSQKNILGLLIFYKPSLTHLKSDKLNIILKSIQEHLSLVLDNFLLYERSVRDGLTNLYNVRFFKSSLLKEMKRTRRHDHNCSLIMIDIDYFKKINDTYGHPTGDNVLKKVAGIFLECSRETDIVSRYGGEEFAIILPETHTGGAYILAEKIRRKTEATEFISNTNQGFNVTLSLGIASSPTDSETTEDLISKADRALYNAKHSGRNCSKKFCDLALEGLS